MTSKSRKSSLSHRHFINCSGSNSIGKQKIADLISQEIQDGEHIFLDASTTAVFIAKNIKNKKKLTVITNSIENLLELSDISE